MMGKKGQRRPPSLILAVIASFACASACGDTPAAPDPLPVTLSILLGDTAPGAATAPTVNLDSIGDTVRVAASAKDAHGNVIQGLRIVWETDAPSVFTVDETGLVKGTGAGDGTLTATLGREGAPPLTATAAVHVAALPIHRDDRAALVALYQASTQGGANPWRDDTNWLTDAPLGDWYGVETDEDGRVAGLNLRQNNLKGPVPTEIGELTALKHLDLTLNNLSALPAEIGRLARLDSLKLARNSLTELPAEIGQLGTLEYLNLIDNDLTKLPTELGGLTALRILYISYNDLTGPIPPEIGRLGRLEQLTLSGNRLTGSIPPEIGLLDRLVYLRLEENFLTGPIPPEIGRLTALQHLNLSNIYTDFGLTGPIPPELGRLAALEHLDVRYNDLTGPIPPEMGQLTRLKALFIHHNGLTGTIPNSFVSWQALMEFNWRQDAHGDLCAPPTDAFRAWLSGRNATGPLCGVNRPPEVGSTSTPTVKGWLAGMAEPFRPGESRSLGVPPEAFRDPDGDPLTYGASTSDATVASATVDGVSILTITATAAGVATITVSARDPGGLEAELSVTVVVVGG